MDHKTPSNLTQERICKIMEKEERIVKECSVCRKEVAVMIYECPSYGSRLCLVCGKNNDWSPNCLKRACETEGIL